MNKADIGTKYYWVKKDKVSNIIGWKRYVVYLNKWEWNKYSDDYHCVDDINDDIGDKDNGDDKNSDNDYDYNLNDSSNDADSIDEDDDEVMMTLIVDIAYHNTSYIIITNKSLQYQLQSLMLS